MVQAEAGLPQGHYLRELAISPDATLMAYAGDVDGETAIYLRPLDTTESRSIAGTAGGRRPFFSPDGQWIGFFAADRLRTVSVRGGPVRDVCEAPAGSAGASWGPDGRIVFAPLDGRGLVAVDAAGGVPETLTRIDAGAGETAHGWPHVLPGGAIAFVIARTSRDARIAVLGPDDPAPRLLLPVNGHVQYISPGYLIYGYAGQLMALAFDPDTLEAGGAPVMIAPGLSGSPLGFDALGVSVFASAPGGAIGYLPGTQAPPPGRLVWVDRDGSSSSLSQKSARQRTPRLSPDGMRIALAVQEGQFGRQIWIENVDGTDRRKLTDEGGDNHSPVWSPDGRELAFASNRTGPQNIYVQPVGRAGAARRLLATDGVHNPGSWRGPLLAYYEVAGETGRDIWLLDGDGVTRPLAATAANERAPALSPDGRWLAYTSNASGSDEVYVRALPDGDPVQVSVGGGTEPVWSTSGLELYYRREDRMMAAQVRVDPTPRVIGTSVVFERAYEHDPGANVPNYDVAADGRFLMLRRADPPGDLRIVLNWVQ